jgi:Secretion system C-terminal sorting domain
LPSAGQATATDACGAPNITSSIGTVLSQGCLRSQTITYTATDGCLNTATCSQVFTWTVDVTPTMFTFCPPNTNLGCNPTTLPSAGQATATDACGAPNITSSIGTVLSQGCLRSQTITYTATDGCQNSATCSQVFTWTVDVTPPMFTFCPPNTNLGCNPRILPSAGQATATDACGAPNITSSIGTVLSQGCLRSQTITYTATDGCQNSATCSQVFTWTVDVTPPVFTFCPTIANLGCNPIVLSPISTATATDDCGIPTITTSLSQITIQGCERFQGKIFTATDGCGNTAICQQFFTYVIDVTPPTFTFCPLGSNLGCNPTGVPAPGSATATDACGAPNITSALGTVTSDGCLRSQTRTYTATDGCQNTATCTQVFTWTVDVTPPTFTFCPPGSNLGCNPTGVPAPGQATATDACGAPTITSALGTVTSNGCLRSQTRTYTATDGCQNTATCTQVFTWTADVTPPTFAAVTDITVECGDPIPAFDPAVSDNCGGQLMISLISGVFIAPCPVVDGFSRCKIATDACGNEARACQKVTIVDTKPPVITFCPTGRNLGCNPTSLPAPGSATATDACGDPTITSALGTISSDGCLRSQTRTYTATDKCGNTATCAQVFTWTEDVTPPTITCPPGSNLGCNPTGIPAAGIATATDACGAPTITTSLNDVIINGCSRSQSRTYKATDGCLNTATCTQVFTWTMDVTPPTITSCPQNVVAIYECVNDIPAANTSAVQATDACGATTTTVSTKETGAPCINLPYIRTYTYTVTDACGNKATCQEVYRINICPQGGMIKPELTKVCGAVPVTLTLSGHVGTVKKWQKQINCTGAWIDIPNTAGLTVYTFTTTPNTNCCFRAVLGCNDVFSTTARVEADTPPIGGIIALASNPNVIQAAICPNTSITLKIWGSVGKVFGWQFNPIASPAWIDIPYSATQPTLVVNGSSLTMTTFYRAIICSPFGTCSGNSSFAYASVFKVSLKANCAPPPPPTLIYNSNVPSTNSVFTSKAYPVPSSDNITLDIEGANEGDASFEIFDLTGKLALKDTRYLKFDKNEVNMDISKLAQGSYLVSITDSEKQQFTLRIHKQD